jgi:hypothetical protein
MKVMFANNVFVPNFDTEIIFYCIFKEPNEIGVLFFRV